MQSQLRQQVIFTAGMLVYAFLSVIASGVLVGSRGVEGALYAVFLCMVPGWLTIFAISLFWRSRSVSLIVFSSTILRMAFVLIGVILVAVIRPDLGLQEFLVWLIAGYFVSLSLETWLIATAIEVGSSN